MCVSIDEDRLQKREIRVHLNEKKIKGMWFLNIVNVSQHYPNIEPTHNKQISVGMKRKNRKRGIFKWQNISTLLKYSLECVRQAI